MEDLISLSNQTWLCGSRLRGSIWLFSVQKRYSYVYISFIPCFDSLIAIWERERSQQEIRENHTERGWIILSFQFKLSSVSLKKIQLSALRNVPLCVNNLDTNLDQWDSTWLQNSCLHQTSEQLELPITAMEKKKGGTRIIPLSLGLIEKLQFLFNLKTSLFLF